MGFLNNSSKMSKLKSFLKNIIVTLDNYSTLLVAVATIALAFFTAFYIWEARQMRIETKRLADLSVEQFKIRAYPTFLIESKEVKFESGKLLEDIRIINKGEITAHKVTFHLVHVYGKYPHFDFINGLGTYYKIDKIMTTVDFQINIFSNAIREIKTETQLYKDYRIESLLYELLFIKFWVPYDEKYRYESFAFLLKQDVVEKNEKLLHWQDIDINAKNNLIKNYFLSNAHKSHKKVENFFKDYPLLKKD